MLPQRNNTPHKRRKYRKKGKSFYDTGDYANPFFPQGKKRGGYRLPWKAKVIVGGVLLFLAAGAWFFFYSNFFTIKNIDVQGGPIIEAGTMEKFARQQMNGDFFILWPQKNIFFFDSRKLADDLNAKYAFDRLEIKKKLPRTLIINFTEKKYAFIWQEGDKYYYADAAGDIITEVNLLEVEQKDYPIIDNLTGQATANNHIAVDKKYSDYVLKLFRAFGDEAARGQLGDDFKIERYVLDAEIDTVKVRTENGPEIYFNTEEPADKQINKLIIVKNEKLKDDFADKSYINLKFGDRVYYQ